MKKSLKIFLIVVACLLVVGLIAGGVATFMLNKAANTEEYTIGSDTIKSVKAVVEKRTVTSVSTSIKDGVTTKTVHYKSDSVQEDLIQYVQYLRQDAEFQLIADMNLAQIPATVQMAKDSKDPGNILYLAIDYDMFGYTITLQKGEGSLTPLG